VEADRLLSAGEEDELPVPALVAVTVRAVQRLMQVADDVHHELQCLNALFLRCLLIREHLGEPLDRIGAPTAASNPTAAVIPSFITPLKGTRWASNPRVVSAGKTWA
jgi:hypothetical protein